MTAVAWVLLAVYLLAAIFLFLDDYRRSEQKPPPLALLLAVPVFLVLPLWRLPSLLVRFYRHDNLLDARSVWRSKRRSIRVLLGGKVWLVWERDRWQPLTVTRLKNCTLVSWWWGQSFSVITWDAGHDPRRKPTQKPKPPADG